MVHAFKSRGRYYALDVDTGALHTLDKLAYGAVLLYGTMAPEAIADRLTEFRREDVLDAIKEIDELKNMGYIFTDHSEEDTVPADESGVIKAMCLHVAHDCNLRCRYCFASTGDFHGERALMPFEVGREALDFLLKHSGNREQLEVDFFGGEPLLNFGVVKQLVQYGRKKEKEYGKKFRFTITTNAYGLNDDNIEFINNNMKNVVLSIDGRKEMHDYMRPTVAGDGSHDKCVRGAKALIQKRGDGEYYVRGTFTNRNIDFTEDVKALVEDGFDEISIEPAVLDETSPYRLSKSDLPGILNEYDKLLDYYEERRKNGKPFNFFHFNISLDGGPCMRKRLVGCGAGTEYVAVTPMGEIYPCHQFVGRDGFLMGNVHDGILDRKIYNAFRNSNVLSKPQCKKCWAHYYCSGGCAANAHAANGDISIPSDIECEMQKKRIECALAVAAERK